MADFNLYSVKEREAAIANVVKADELMAKLKKEISNLEDQIETIRTQYCLLRDQRAATMSAYAITLWRTDREGNEYQLK